MNMHVYVSFKGDCEAAFAFYEQTLGATPGAVFRYAGSSLADTVPAGWQNKIMHGSLTIGEQVVMGADVLPEQYEAPTGVSLSLHMKSVAEADRIFHALEQGGQVRVPIEKTFWAERFGMVTDRFGVPWMINCEGENQ